MTLFQIDRQAGNESNAIVWLKTRLNTRFDHLPNQLLRFWVFLTTRDRNFLPTAVGQLESRRLVDDKWAAVFSMAAG